MASLTWRDVVVKLLSHEGHRPMQMRVQYVGERIKWFFEVQKECVLDFMSSVDLTPSARMFSQSYAKHARFMKQNELIKHLVFETYDDVCQRQLNAFMDMFQSMLTSTFSNPWIFLKSATAGSGSEALPPPADEVDAKERIPQEAQSRSSIETVLSRWLMDIPTDVHKVDEAVDKVQKLILRTYSLIRSQVCDQVELFAHSFFKLPMLRKLEEEMSSMVLSKADLANYEERRQHLAAELRGARAALQEVNDCTALLEGFRSKRATHWQPPRSPGMPPAGRVTSLRQFWGGNGNSPGATNK